MQRQVSPAGLVTEERLKELLREVQYSEDFCKPYHERAKSFYKQTRQFSKGEDWPYTNEIHTPDTLAFVEDAASKIYNQLYGTIPFLTFKARRNRRNKRVLFGDAMRIADALEDCVAWQIENDVGRFMMESYAAEKNKCMYGTRHLGVFPEYDKYKGNMVCVGAKFKSADFWDLLPNPNDWLGGRWASWQYERELLSKDTVAKLFEDGTFKGKLEDVPTMTSSEDDPEVSWHKKMLEELGWEDWVPAPDDKELWEVLHRYENGHVITIINRGYVCRDTANSKEMKGEAYLPYNVPYQDGKYIIFDKEYFGMGIPEAIETLANDKDLIRSQHRDNVDLILNAIVKYRRDADLPFDLYESFPTAKWPMDDPLNDVIIERPNDVTSQQVLAIEGKIEFDMDRAVGSSRYARGETPPHAREGVGTVIRLQQASLGRIDTQIRLTEAVGVRGLGWQLALIAQNEMHDDIFEKVTGYTKRDVFGEGDEAEWDIRFKVDAFPLGSSIAAVKELHVEQMLQILQIVSQIDPKLMMASENPRSVDMGEIVAQTVRAMGLSEEEVDRVVPVANDQNTLGPGQRGGPEDQAAVQQALQEVQFGQGGGI